MDIASLSTAMAKSQVEQQSGILMLKKSMQATEQSAAQIIKMMDQAVTPGLGAKIDYSI